MEERNGAAPSATDIAESERTVQVDCLCPNQRHGEKGDQIVLKPKLDFVAVRAIRYAGGAIQAEDPGSSIATLMAVMAEGFVLHGIESWTLRDARNQLIEVNRENVRRYVLEDPVASQVVADAADLIYQPQVIHPLVELARRSSPPSPTNESTSAPSDSGSTSPSAMSLDETPSNPGSSTPSGKSPKRSKRSSTTSTRTVSIGATTDDSGGAFTS